MHKTTFIVFDCANVTFRNVLLGDGLSRIISGYYLAVDQIVHSSAEQVINVFASTNSTLFTLFECTFSIVHGADEFFSLSDVKVNFPCLLT